MDNTESEFVDVTIRLPRYGAKTISLVSQHLWMNIEWLFKSAGAQFISIRPAQGDGP